MVVLNLNLSWEEIDEHNSLQNSASSNKLLPSHDVVRYTWLGQR